MSVKCETNRYWDENNRPFITVMTPVYNRRLTLGRTMKSVEEQTFRNIEYIIIDDGSTENIDDVVRSFMKSVDFPVMFVKKNNGGVHTARNVGYKNARGRLVLCIDSDDELTPNACEIFYKAWMSIPKDKKKDYWQIKAQCVDQNGKMVAKPFPDNINRLSKEKARSFFSMASGEQIGCRVTKVMKDNLFPEPDGITFVVESAVWIPLERQYRSWGINDMVRVYHKEGGDHLAGGWRKKDRQNLKNNLWSVVYMLNCPEKFGFSFFQHIKMIIKYCVFSQLLSKRGDKEFIYGNRIKGFFNNFWKIILWLPSSLYVKMIVKDKTK